MQKSAMCVDKKKPILSPILTKYSLLTKEKPEQPTQQRTANDNLK